MATQDPFEPYLLQAERLYTEGDVIKAGQIWQAILKRIPDHAQAQAGLRKVRLHFDVRATQEPARPPKAGIGETHPEAPGVSTSVGLAPAQTPEVAALLEQGCLLYDHGHVQDALQAWERILTRDPDNPLARGYINMARRQLGQPLLPQAPVPQDGPIAPAPPPLPPPAPEAPEPPPEPQVHEDTEEELLRKGCTLFELGQLEDALAAWERLLARNPTHPLARDYAAEAHRQLGLEGPVAPPAPPPAPAAMPAPGPPADPGIAQDETLQRRVEEGVQLYEMGMTDEALARWESVLQQAPGHPMAQGYLEMARKALAPPTGAPVAAVPPPPEPGTLPGLSPAAEAKNLLRTAQALFQAGHLAESGEAYRRILERIPAHPEALHGLRQIQALLLSQPPPPEPDPEPGTPDLPPVVAPLPIEPPAAIVQAEGPGRRGLETPALVKRIQLPPFLQDTRNQVIALASVALLLAGSLTCHRWRRDVALREARASAMQAAEDEASHSTRPYALTFGPQEMRIEVKALEAHEPLGAFLLAQELARLTPEDASLPALAEEARRLLEAQGPPGTADLAAAQAMLQRGEMDAALEAARGLLRAQPGDAEARRLLATALRLRVREYARRERWPEVRDALRLGRALYPHDKAWMGRLRLVDLVEAMPKGERGPWIDLLG